ncbi:unnamed protein product, partial [Didymodactylos carnosus]
IAITVMFSVSLSKTKTEKDDPFANMRTNRSGGSSTQPQVSFQDEIKKQIQLYENSATYSSSQDNNPLVFWREQQQILTILAKIAKSIYVIQASSAESERHFSTSGQIVTEQRSQLDPECMASNEQKLDMALDDIIKDNRRQNNNRGRGRGARNPVQRQQRRGGTFQNRRGTTARGRVTKSYNRGISRGNTYRGRGGYTLNRNNRSSNYQQNSNTYRGSNNNRRPSRRGYRSNPSATFNPLRRDTTSPPRQQAQQQQLRSRNSLTNRNQGGNKTGAQNVGALRRRMVAAQRALNRAQKTLASMPKIKLQRQKFLQQPETLAHIISRNRKNGAITKRSSLGRKSASASANNNRRRRMFV